MKEDGTYSLPGEDALQLLRETHFPASTDFSPELYDLSKKIKSSSLSDKLHEWINLPTKYFSAV